MSKHIIIIGNGISGITCARNIRKKSDSRITVISGETDHFYSRTALMYIYMGHMRYEDTKPYEDRFWKKNRIELVKKFVERVDAQNKTLHFSDATTLSFDVLVIAAGSKSNRFGWPGQELSGVQGLYHLQDLVQMEENTKGITKSVIVGGGLIGIEMAEMLRSRNIEVCFLVREKNFWNSILHIQESQAISNHIREHHVDLRLGTELLEIRGDENGKVKSAITNSGEEIPCEFIGLTVGVNPNIEFLKGGTIDTDRGILVNEYFETNVADIYAIGDCAQIRNPLPGRKPVEQVWYTGRMHGETLAQTICGKRTAYAPGHWFNSAKFFDIEYQTYGVVDPNLKEDEETYYWEHTSRKVCFRAVYGKGNGKLIGINVLGMRIRHEVIDRWLSDSRHIEYVLQHLPDAVFDPEFYSRYESEIIEQYNREKNVSLKPIKKSWNRILNLTN